MSKRKRYAAEEIIAKLREAEVHLAQGDTVGQAVRKLGVSEQTYYLCYQKMSSTRMSRGETLVLVMQPAQDRPTHDLALAPGQ